MFFAIEESTFILSCGLFKNCFSFEFSILVKSSIVGVEMLLSWLIPPLQFTLLSISISVDALENIVIPFLFALSMKLIILERSLICVLLAMINSI